MSADEKADGSSPDVLLVHGRSESGEGLRVLRAHEGKLEAGELRTLKEGEPLKGEVVKLKPRSEHRLLFDVETVLPREELQGSRTSGPAQVATEAYRQNWDTVFGSARRGYLN